MTRGIRITCLYGLYHYLKKFLSAVLKLVIQAVHVADCDYWDNHTNKPNGPESDPSIHSRVEPGHEN